MERDPTTGEAAPPTRIVREEPVGSVVNLARAVAAAEVGAPPAGGALGFRAECVQCGMVLDEGLFRALGVAEPQGQTVDARLARLRLGYCARNGCDSHYYRLTLTPGPGVDWFGLLGAGAGTARADAALEDPAVALRREAFRRQVRRGAVRVAAGVGVVLVLILARHWYRGGTIPMLREPEDFVVDRWPAPADSAR